MATKQQYCVIMLFLIVALNFGCNNNKEVYFEYLYSHPLGEKRYNHYLYVKGKYTLKDSIFEIAACQHTDTMGVDTPITTVGFLRSREGTERFGRPISWHSVDFDKVQKNQLLTIVYDLSRKKTNLGCPAIKYIRYNQTGETVKRDDAYYKYLFSETMGKEIYRHYLFVGGYYNNLKPDDFVEAACQHVDTVGLEKPIAEVIFLYSDKEVGRPVYSKPIDPIGELPYEMKKNELFSIVYDLSKIDTGFLCPYVKYVFYNKSGETIQGEVFNKLKRKTFPKRMTPIKK